MRLPGRARHRYMFPKSLFGLVFFVVWFLPGVAGLRLGAGEILTGPVPALPLRVVDGDTVIVRARIWLGQDIAVQVRIAGIDAPEMRGRCEAERQQAIAARDLIAGLMEAGPVTLSDIHYGKYAGRVVARVTGAGGEDFAGLLLKAELARPYQGGRRAPWCQAAGSKMRARGQR